MKWLLDSLSGAPMIIRPRRSRGAVEYASGRRDLREWIETWWPWARRRAEEAEAREVFRVLDMQMRLTTLTAILRRIDSDPDMFARQHHWRTTLWAYDSMLADACALAGLPVLSVPAGPKADAERARRELELCGRGWTW